MPDNFESDQNNVSLTKRWEFIQSECNNFCGAIEHVNHRNLSEHGIIDMVRICHL
jgi:hypothetical protein